MQPPIKKTLPFWNIWARLAISPLKPLLIPTEIIDKAHGLDRAIRLMREGVGLVLLINHFSLRDSIQALVLIFQTPVLRSRTIIAPIAYHQYLQYGRLGRFLAWLFGIRLQPVVTDDTVRILHDHPPHGSGLKAYRRTAANALAAGQIVLLAPQGGRRESLGTPPGRPVASLVNAVQKGHLGEVVLLCVGLALKGAQHYALSSVGGLNLGRVYQVRIGPAVLAKEVMATAGSMRQVDKWTFDQLAKLTPAVYSKIENRKEV